MSESDPITRLNAALEGHYRVESELGEGGMATVYLADDLKHGRKVALKVLKPELAAVVGAERFLAEIKTTANLQHPHILPLHDSGDADGFLFYVMPYVEGESLREKLDREHQLSIDEAVRLTTDIAEALGAAHEHGVVHRDIKPANILLSRGRPLVADFGIALTVDAVGGGRLTETGLLIGTPQYMSPEQAAGESHIDARSDIYSLAAMLYEMLAGEPPYTGRTPQVVLAKRLTDPVPSVRRLRDKVPESVDEAIQRALAPVPADRFATTADFVDALTSTPEPTQETGRKAWAVAAFVGVLLAVAGIGLGRWGGGDAVADPGLPSIAVLPFEDLSPEGDQQYFVEGLSEEIITALSQIPDLKVAARTSTFLLAAQGTDIATIASTLGVANVLEGSVRKEGDQIRVAATLIEAESGFQLWSDTYNRELTGVFAIQDEIARAITSQLQVTLTGNQQTQLVPVATAHLEAYEAYLRGRHLWNQRTRESVQAAIMQFQRAVDIDPDYAEAYSGLADAYLVLDVALGTVRADWEFEANSEQAIAAARTSIALDSDLGTARVSLGFGLWSVGEWEGAVQELEQAINLSPRNADAHHWLGIVLWTLGKPEQALIPAETAHRLDPVSDIISWNLGTALLAAGRTEEAVAQYVETTELAPDWFLGWESLARVLLGRGEHDEALRAAAMAAQARGVDVDVATEAFRAVIRYQETGEPQSFSDFDWNLHALIWLHAQAGNVDRAIGLLGAYVRAGAYGWAAMGHVLYASDLVREDPRYDALLAEAGITW